MMGVVARNRVSTKWVIFYFETRRKINARGLMFSQRIVCGVARRQAEMLLYWRPITYWQTKQKSITASPIWQMWWITYVMASEKTTYAPNENQRWMRVGCPCNSNGKQMIRPNLLRENAILKIICGWAGARSWKVCIRLVVNEYINGSKAFSLGRRNKLCPSKHHERMPSCGAVPRFLILACRAKTFSNKH